MVKRQKYCPLITTTLNNIYKPDGADLQSVIDNTYIKYDEQKAIKQL